MRCVTKSFLTFVPQSRKRLHIHLLNIPLETTTPKGNIKSNPNLWKLARERRLLCKVRGLW